MAHVTLLHYDCGQSVFLRCSEHWEPGDILSGPN